ncbi:MAG: glutamate racemase [Myxococcota bacterium]
MIGLFDSGVGGLTVADAFAKRVPGAALALVADQAHVPYGGRPVDEVAAFAAAQSDLLFEQGAELVVMACNLSSAVALANARARHGADRVFGMVEAGAVAARARTRRGRVGVLATSGTVSTHAYGLALAALEVTEVACPDFVPLVEAGDIESPKSKAAVDRALAPLRRADCDVVILGCTHYPFLLPTLRLLGPEFDFVDPAQALAEGLASRIRPGPSRMWTTGDRLRFRSQLARWCPKLQPLLGEARWCEGRLLVDEAQAAD